MTFHVTAQMILEGHTSSCHSCPVALAIQARVPGARVFADYQTLWVNLRWYPTPVPVRRFMERFDGTHGWAHVRPLRFTVPVPGDEEATDAT